jgi:hypothetical protein
MIRRNPTLIAMSDLDVQDVRNMANKEIQDIMDAANQEIIDSDKHPIAFMPDYEPRSISTDPSKPINAAEDARRKREAMTRNERLGLS